MIDRAQAMRPMLEVANIAVLDVKLARDCDSPSRSPAMVWISPANSILPTRRRASRKISDFLFHLESTIDVLVVAAAAALEVGASRRDTRSRWRNHFDQASPAKDRFLTRSISARTTSPGST